MINYSVAPRINPLNPNAAPKYFAVAQYVRYLDINDFARHIATHGCVYSRADISAILTMAVDCIKEQLLAGNKVKLGELGDFSIGLCSHGTKTREEFVPSKIHKVNVNWTPGSLFKGLIDEAQFHKVSTRLAQQAILDAETNGDKPVNLAELKAKNKKDEDGVQD